MIIELTNENFEEKVLKSDVPVLVDFWATWLIVENKELDDMVLIKSDSYPTYNFANVIDDHLMGITHVVRGNEYLSSSPKYNRLYKTFSLKFLYAIITLKEVIAIAKNTKQTSKTVASKASKLLRDGRTSKTTKSVAGSALSQTKKSK